MSYTRNDIINKLNEYNINTLYQGDMNNYLGKTEDTNELYTEVICEWICSNFDKLNQITNITREKSYNNQSVHDGKINNTNRVEENIAKSMYHKEYDYIGKILDYQVPLKNKKNDIAGKMDLLACDGQNVVVRILELKKPTSTESLLRCIIEGYTYEKTVDKQKLVKDFNLENCKVISCPFIFKNSVQDNQLKDLDNRPNLKKLLCLLNTEIYLIEEKENKYIITKGL